MKYCFFISFIFYLAACNNTDATIEDDGTTPPTTNPAFQVHTVAVSDQLTIDIYVPSVPHPSGSYPIVYINDGDLFTSVISNLTYVNFDSVDSPEPFMIVGIHSAGKRTDWFTPYTDPWITANWGSYVPGAHTYTQGIIDSVIPYVESTYSVDRKRRAIFGFSLGGLHATWAAINYPDVFSFAGAMSPSFWVADYAIFNEVRQSMNNRYYFDIGTGEWNNYVPLIASLESGGLEYGEDIFYYEVPQGVHSPTDWAARINIPLRLFLEGKPDELKQYELEVACIPSQSTAGLYFQRLNPMVKFNNEVRYSLTTSADFRVVSGLGEVTEDGRFLAEAGSMTVEVSHGAWSEMVSLTNCGH